MNARQYASTRGRAVRATATIATAALAGVALGSAGASLALWSDSASFSGEISSGYEHFAAGHVDDTVAAVAGAASVSVGAAEATTLVDTGALAVPMQIDAISQGNKGLRYEVIEPAWGDGVFGAAEVAVFSVGAAEDCTIETIPTAGPLASTPVASDYSDSETPVTEFWCLVATLDGLPDEGAYTNTVEVTSEDDAGNTVTDEDAWNADVASAIDPAAEADHDIIFEYETFRPEEGTP